MEIWTLARGGRKFCDSWSKKRTTGWKLERWQSSSRVDQRLQAAEVKSQESFPFDQEGEGQDIEKAGGRFVAR